jgi:hypothetical protein
LVSISAALTDSRKRELRHARSFLTQPPAAPLLRQRSGIFGRDSGREIAGVSFYNFSFARLATPFCTSPKAT